MSLQQIVKNWFDGAKEAWEISDQLFETRKYSYSLFFVHLALEKTLKGLHLKKFSEPAFYSHDLKKIAMAIGLKLSETDLKQLDEISSYNISARYDEVKQRLYKKATNEYTKEWREKGKGFYEKFLKEAKKYG